MGGPALARPALVLYHGLQPRVKPRGAGAPRSTGLGRQGRSRLRTKAILLDPDRGNDAGMSRSVPRHPQEEAEVLRPLQAARHRRAGLPRHRRGRCRFAVPAGEHPIRAALDRHHDQRRHRGLGQGFRGRGGRECHSRPRLPPLPHGEDHGQVLQAQGSARRDAEKGGLTRSGESALVRSVKMHWRVRRN